jgi:cysteinyl-tRNA synthetase
VHGRGAAYWRHGVSSTTLERGDTIDLATLRNVGTAARTTVAPDHHASTDLDALGERVAAGGPESVAALAHLLKRAANGGDGLIDPTSLVDGVLQARQHARASKQFDLADELRDAVVSSGIEVHDSPDGATWSLPNGGGSQ